ncbi:tripartite tricarboxylate transporter substrate-binding protein [Acidovorax sp. SUPP3334]|uniref:tripartite tricarboxylate transporter substrate-binding protein n=1 Tax=Acidovorax sp. SUPP3334 TaxID=2920881 RepID=UPI0023DE2081|nr:tripartite tricarboxylate transporter substrate-binding protein [Acidovorax sp. SUPP3334]GKT26984.1 hypothetical protein AVHM3334_22555 [Acidovorax sp. SUPP3334]
MKFDAVRSFTPLCTVATSPTVLVVGPGLPVKSLADCMARARKEPGHVTAGTAGVGSSGHFATEMFARANGLRINHVPYKGAAPVVTDLMGGQLDSSFATLGSVLPQIRSGKLKALAVASPRRSVLLPEVSKFADAWYGVHDPRGRLYCLRPNGQIHLLLRNVPSPNGVAPSPDGRVPCLSVTLGNCVWRVPLLPDGGISKVSQFFMPYGPSGPDGLAVDEDERLMVANPGLGYVWVFNARAEPERVLLDVELQ